MLYSVQETVDHLLGRLHFNESITSLTLLFILAIITVFYTERFVHHWGLDNQGKSDFRKRRFRYFQ